MCIRILKKKIVYLSMFFYLSLFFYRYLLLLLLLNIFNIGGEGKKKEDVI